MTLPSPSNRGRLLALGLLVLGLGCGPGYGKRVPDGLVAKLPYEARIELLEAENDLAVAVEKRDEAENEVLRTRAAIREAKSRARAADDELGRAKEAASKEVAQLALAEGQARLAFHRARQALNLERREIDQLSLQCALARYQLARLTAARRAKVAGSEKLDPAAFEGQVKGCEDEVKTRQAKAKPKEQALSAARTDWEQRKTTLAQKTFDARASPFVE
jgi:hypothetical protein